LKSTPCGTIFDTKHDELNSANKKTIMQELKFHRRFGPSITAIQANVRFDCLMSSQRSQNEKKTLIVAF
jgi:hypothetical protein